MNEYSATRLVQWLLCFNFLFFLMESHQASAATPLRPIMPRGPLSAEELATAQLFEQASASVVHIRTSTRQRDLFSFNVFEVPKGTGTGFLWDSAGHVVTNFHVIKGAARAQITLRDRTTLSASLVGIAPERDLAVLRINLGNKQLTPSPLGTSHDLVVGQKVFAIGNPFGFDQSLTTGVISALGREIKAVTRTPIKDVIQTDAAINPGNSGGPLLDSAGRVVGVNTAIFSPSGAYAGIGFAIPIETVNWVVSELIAYGKISRPDLGVEIASDYVTTALRLPGALVTEVKANSPAAKAGLRPTVIQRGRITRLGDLIIKIGKHKITSARQVYELLLGYNSGQLVKITILRDKRQMLIEVKL